MWSKERFSIWYKSRNIPLVYENKYPKITKEMLLQVFDKVNGASKVNLDNRANNFEKLYKSQIFNEFP